MKIFRTFILIIIVLLMGGGCQPDKDTFEIDSKPNWIVLSPETYPYSFTAIVCLPTDINTHSQDDDLVAAFIDDECRGTGNLVKSEDGSKRVYFVTVRGSSSENGEIFFRYYNTRLNQLYQTVTSVAFVIDGTYGNYDNPVVLDLKLI